MKGKLTFLFLLILSQPYLYGQGYNALSPDGKLKIDVQVDHDIRWQVSLNGTNIILPTPISVQLKDRLIGENPKVRKTENNKVRDEIKPVVPLKDKIVKNDYNELLLSFKGNYKITFRVFNNGVAYRFQTNFKKGIEVYDENLTVNFASDYQVYFPEEESYISHYERLYIDTTLSAISKDRFCSLPVLIKTDKGANVLISEAGLFDYPNMFFYGTRTNALKAGFPKAVLETSPVSDRPDRDENITKKATYIAKTDGSRTFPWRVFTITQNDKQLAESNLVYQLARPTALETTDWIHPGKVAWDWYNANNIYGVDFRAGLNTDTYKYYIDFAASLDLDYIILDEGWSKSTTDLTAANPDIDLKDLFSYAKSKDVGIILWMLWKPLEQDMGALLDRFESWGARGIKVDFMQRADQGMVNYYENVAREAAKRHLLVDFHGAFKPVGLQRTYPNVMTFEGVKGLENNKWSKIITPDHNLMLPFTRNVAGPMDYTPGAMVNANKESFRAIFDTPMSMGTRCHQLAMYVVYESPLQMLADSPTKYYKEPGSASFIAKIPVTWDETKVMEAKVGDYILTARQKDGKWYVGAMTDWTPREFTLDCSFLDAGNYHIEIMQDGVNADRNANDYKKITKEITSKSKLQLNLAPGGGWAAIIEKTQ